MEGWSYIAAAVLGNAVLIGALAWAAKAVITQILQRDSLRVSADLKRQVDTEVETLKADLKAKADTAVETLKADLKAQADSATERLKGELQLRAIEHQVRFARLHEKQAAVIAELYGLVVEALWEAESFLSLVTFVGEPDKRTKARAAQDKLVELYRYFDKHRVYLPESVCGVVDKLVTDVRGHVISFDTYLTWDDDVMHPNTLKEKHEVWMGGWRAIKEQVPAVRRELEQELRKLLGPGA